MTDDPTRAPPCLRYRAVTELAGSGSVSETDVPGWQAAKSSTVEIAQHQVSILLINFDIIKYGVDLSGLPRAKDGLIPLIHNAAFNELLQVFGHCANLIETWLHSTNLIGKR